MDDEAKERIRQQTAARTRAYRQRKRERMGETPKPRGGQPSDNPHRQRAIYLTDEEWAHCRAQPGGGSEFVRQLVIDHREFHENGTLPRWLQKDAATDDEGTGKS